MALATARTLAWALLMLGWLTLGPLGRTSWPLVAGGLLPTALWLLVIGSAQQLTRRHLAGPAMLRWTVGAAALATAAALACPPGAGAAVVAAMAWGVLVVAASRVVRSLRSGPAPAPVLPAAAGSALAWAAGASPVAAAAGVVAAALLLMLLGGAGRATRGCRSGLFDCALPGVDARAWRSPAELLSTAARWTMLPMMATLALMGDWCSARLGLDSGSVVGLHLAAMLLPPLLLRGAGPAWVLAPLAAAALCPWLLPGVGGVMAASLCCGVSWGLAWKAELARRDGARPSSSPSFGAALWPAVSALATGVAIDHAGPAALGWLLAAVMAAAVAVHAARPRAGRAI